jgi:hypothetical protein
MQHRPNSEGSVCWAIDHDTDNDKDNEKLDSLKGFRAVRLDMMF